MDVGVVLPGRGPWELVVRLASMAESSGLASVWLADPAGDDPVQVAGGEERLEALTALAGLARTTSTIRLGALLRSRLRLPAVAGKALSTIDVLSGGRLIVALAEHEGTPREAGALGEAVQVLRGAFGGGPFTFLGDHHRVEGLRCRPRPVQLPSPPIWVTGAGDALLGVAARHADGLAPPPATTVADCAVFATAVDAACRQVGRDPAGLHRFARVPVAADRPEAAAADVATWAAAGVATLLLDAGALALPETLGDALELVASSLPSAR